MTLKTARWFLIGIFGALVVVTLVAAAGSRTDTLRALVTERMQPLRLDGKVIHQIGMPWHFGYGGYAQGGIANDLSALIEDPNSRIHEAKAFTCAIRKGRIAGEGERPL